MSLSIAHSNLLRKANEIERQGDLNNAEKLYLKVLEKDPYTIEAYKRLMVIFRKQKEYSKELQVINRAVKALDEQVQTQKQRWMQKHKKIASASLALAKKMGIANKAGKMIIDSPLMLQWAKRKELVKKRIKNG
ncbi:tetratricopeptide repeat protein [Pinibacter aurantiacus]|uniref:Tetratricopeptide repeat protein n=1 Tax=Pinibacter aurantiacus TaxID=2851599 RepID=A0A9E2S6Y1_9BACT|nr:hypothetical protein [Pinibacter aurantiacus]MBV4355844.1 hypothetical protein [Pinibacter aurantiacus]